MPEQAPTSVHVHHPHRHRRRIRDAHPTPKPPVRGRWPVGRRTLTRRARKNLLAAHHHHAAIVSPGAATCPWPAARRNRTADRARAVFPLTTSTSDRGIGEPGKTAIVGLRRGCVKRSGFRFLFRKECEFESRRSHAYLADLATVSLPRFFPRFSRFRSRSAALHDPELDRARLRSLCCPRLHVRLILHGRGPMPELRSHELASGSTAASDRAVAAP